MLISGAYSVFGIRSYFSCSRSEKFRTFVYFNFGVLLQDN